ncbi:YdeI/OmpD-associated family protein [Nitrosomonas sp.]|uniref:YdeI/OmpD-associated family protein n=1 Tax=Nitrosomonas sp. TaxID=42353 RepID=UPI0026309DF0|nr:YdeI/OmpD-associated family protein [Nitrosomonas sp.]MCW5602283.1 YdeI/OmpD-associated family protein [Nitrosomonas sp.]
MTKRVTSSGVAHELPADLKKALITNPEALETWEDITPLARNEWICWVESAKKLATRHKRINRRLQKPV